MDRNFIVLRSNDMINFSWQLILIAEQPHFSLFSSAIAAAETRHVQIDLFFLSLLSKRQWTGVCEPQDFPHYVSALASSFICKIWFPSLEQHLLLFREPVDEPSLFGVSTTRSLNVMLCRQGT